MTDLVPSLREWLELNLAALGLRALAALLILAVGAAIARAGGSAARAALLRTPLRSRGLLVEFLVRTVRTVVLVFAGVVALGQLGVDIGPLIAGIGISGFIVGFAFKDSLSNFAAGLLLLFYQPFEVGDVVEVGGIGGTVRGMSVAATELVLPDGRLAIVPNSRIWNAPIINFDRLGQRRLEWTVPVPAAADLGAAIPALQRAAAGHPRVLPDPPPLVVVSALNASSVELTVRAWVAPADAGAVTSEVRRALKEALDAQMG